MEGSKRRYRITAFVGHRRNLSSEMPERQASGVLQFEDGYRCHSSKWKPCPITEVNVFYKDSWGAPGRAKLNAALPGTVLDIVPPAIANFWSIGFDTGGKLYLREELLLIANRVRACFAQGGPEGVLLTGQPGTGKSFSLLFMLLHCLADEHPVMFTSDGVTHLFTGAGVYICDAQFFNYIDIPVKDNNPQNRVWSLVEPTGDDLEPNAALVGRMVFPVYASSHEDRCKNWLKRMHPKRFIMETWSLEDLQKCMPLYPTPLSDADVATALAQSGPCPRDINEYLTSPTLYARRRQMALDEIQTAEAIRKLVVKTARGAQAHSSSHQLFAIHRASPADENTVDDDVGTVDVKSDAVLAMLQQRFNHVRLDDAVRIFQALSVAPESSSLAGWAFENLSRALHSSKMAQPQPPP